LTSLPSTISSIAVSTGTLNTSSLFVNVVSSQQILASSILGNQLQFVTLSSQALYVSSFYTATRQVTPMFVTF
jgi:hypothetical protein